MNRRITITLIFLVVIALSTTLFACDSTPDYTNNGLTVSGKFIYDGAPLNGVKIILDYEVVATTDEGGIFSVDGLENGDELTFEKDGFVFYPDSHKVSGDVYDLRVEAYLDTTVGTPDDDQNGDNTGNNSGDNSGENSGNNDSENTDDNGSGDDLSGGNDTDDTTTEIKTYDCINAGLSFENDNIKLVFCVEKGFSSLSVSVFTDGTSSSINVTDDIKVAEFNLGESTFVQYEIDVTDFAKEECVFTVSPLNEKGEKGEEASVAVIPQSTAKAVTITLDGSVVKLYNIDTDATNYLVINDVNMGVVNSDTVDLSAYKTLSDGVVSIRILSVKEGSFPSYSNTINVELQVQNDND